MRYIWRFILAFIFALLVGSGGRCADDPIGTGTGFVVNAKGYLLTCRHVVKEAGKVQVTLDGKSYDAVVLSEDEKHDLALLQIRATGLSALALANSNAVEVGLDVRAFGYPLSSVLGDDLKVTRGTVAGISNQGGIKAFQIDASVNPGNSGGPLLNEMGDVIGVVNAKLVGEDVSSVGFAVPINYAKSLFTDEGVAYLSGNAAAKRDGPALVKKASPSVALVTVWGKGAASASPKKPLPTPSSPSRGATAVNPKDGAAMVWVPAGEFLMGSNDGASDEKPQRTVYLDGYWMYKYEVTVAQYRKFCEATGRKMPDAPIWGWQDSHPIVKVSWNDGKAYADWAGARLPLEAEWEKAARGTDGRMYPWGNTWDASKCAANLTSTQPVGSYDSGASPYGCMDMAGNVWEWCADWYDGDYYKTSPSRNPKGPSGGSYRVLRGGSWDYDADNNRCACRHYSDPYSSLNYSGFRLVR